MFGLGKKANIREDVQYHSQPLVFCNKCSNVMPVDIEGIASDSILSCPVCQHPDTFKSWLKREIGKRMMAMKVLPDGQTQFLDKKDVFKQDYLSIIRKIKGQNP